MKRAGAEILFKVNRAILLGIFLASALAAGGLPGEPLYAQEAVGLNTEKGVISLTDYNQYSGTLISSRTTNTSISETLRNKYTPNNFCSNTAVMAVGPFTVSDSHHYDGGSFRGGSEGSYSMYVYAAVIPNKSLRVKINGNLSLNWNNFVTAGDRAYTQFYFLDTDGGSSAAIGYNSVVASGSLSGIKILEHNTSGDASKCYLAGGGIQYCRIGKIVLTGFINAQADNGVKTASFNSTVLENIDVRYIGEILKKAEGQNGDNQTWITGQKVPNPLIVKVSSGITGELLNGRTVVFTAYDPGGAVSSQASTVTINGLARMYLTLGSSSGTYTVRAVCASCIPGLNEAVFTENAKTNEQATKLTEMFCDGAHFYGQKLKNPLRVKALNLYTNKGEKDFAVVFSPVGSPQGTIHTLNSNTDANGLARTEFTLGNDLGIYTINAHCGQCLAGPDVTCKVRAIPLPDAEHDSPPIDLKKRKRGVNIVIAPGEVYPQGAGGTPTEAQVTITGASENTLFTARVVAGANTGGHQHHDANRPKGTLAGAGPTSCTGSDLITCTTDSNGYAQMRYASGGVGGWDTILVKMNTGEEGDAIVKVRVPELTYLPIPNASYTYATNDAKHPNNLYGKQELINGVQQIAQAYKAKYNAKISVNDMSLINGGIFDVSANWVPNPHECHKTGMSVDFNRAHIKPSGQETIMDIAVRIDNLLAPNNINCRRIVESDPTLAHFECPRTSNCY